MAKYQEYSFDKTRGKWYGIDKHGISHEVSTRNVPRSILPRRSYNAKGFYRGGWLSVPKDEKYSFPRGIVKEYKPGKYRINRQFTKAEYKKQPFSALNAKKGGVGVIDGRSFAKHVFMVREKLSMNAQNFAVILSLRAIKIFQDSFKYKRFYSADGDKWQDLDPKTIKKRKRRGTWPGAGGMLMESGDMFQSVYNYKMLNDGIVTYGVRVFTDPKDYHSRKYVGKRKFSRGKVSVMRRFCYAGLHNNGGYIRGGHRLPKRQFMGHSTYLFDYANRQITKYLFYDVFN